MTFPTGPQVTGIGYSDIIGIFAQKVGYRTLYLSFNVNALFYWLHSGYNQWKYIFGTGHTFKKE